MGASWNNMCGESEQALQNHRLQQFASAIEMAMTAAAAIVEMVQQNKFLGKGLHDTVQAIIDFAATFVFAKCSAVYAAQAEDAPRRLLLLPAPSAIIV